MQAQDLMTRKVHAVTLTTPVRRIADLMIRHRISALPVVDDRRHVLGIVTEGDLLRRTEIGTQRQPSWWLRLIGDPDDEAREYVKSRGARARDVMTRVVVSVKPTTSAADIAILMEKWNIKRVPVVRGGKLVGVVSRRDLMRAIRDSAPSRRGAVASDKILYERFRQQLASEVWGDSAMVNFAVDKGRVELNGLVSSVAQRDAVRVMAENIRGVQSVKDSLTVAPRRAHV